MVEEDLPTRSPPSNALRANLLSSNSWKTTTQGWLRNSPKNATTNAVEDVVEETEDDVELEEERKTNNEHRMSMTTTTTVISPTRTASKGTSSSK